MNLRELKYVIYGDDRLSNKLNKISGASDKANNALGRTTKKTGLAQAKFKGMASELPIVGRGLSMLASPAGIAAGSVLAIGAAFNKSIDEASVFNSTFRELENMNLSKTKAEIKSLKSTILDLSFDQGFDANQASTGFYDVQSITGKYGAEVESIVAKQGKFAQVMKANFNEWITGSAKSMANYGFGADELDRYNASAAATIQVGVTTYDQYAKVSSVFSGSAAAAKQSYDSSNKLFALFTKNNKTVDESATMVKSAFNDLFKDSSIDAFKSVGIDLFDVNKKAKQVDVIMRELNAKFAKADNDQAMTKLRNQFKGSEGLIALVQQASDQTGNLTRTLDEFDEAKKAFDFGLAEKAFNKDLIAINNTINNKMKAAWIGLGNAVLPIWVGIKEEIVRALDGAKKLFEYATGSNKDKVYNKYRSEVIGANQEFTDNIGSKSTNEVMNKLEGFTREARISDTLIDDLMKKNGVRKSSDLPDSAKREFDILRGERDAYNKLGDFYKEIVDDRGADWKPTKVKVDNTDNTNNDSSTPNSAITKGLASISGGGSRVRNISVVIEKQIETVNLHAATIKEGLAEVRDIVQEEMTRAVGGFEQSMR